MPNFVANDFPDFRPLQPLNSVTVPEVGTGCRKLTGIRQLNQKDQLLPSEGRAFQMILIDRATALGDRERWSHCGCEQS